MLTGKGCSNNMEDDSDGDLVPWSNGQCSRTAGVKTKEIRTAEVNTAGLTGMTNFNISNIVNKESHSTTRLSGLSATIPVGVVTARQRVTTTTNVEFVSSISSSPAVSSIQTPFLTTSIATSSNIQSPFLTSALQPPPPPLLAHPAPLHPHQLPPPMPPPPPPSYPPYLFGYPDPHYYYFLQQQLLLLQHHQYLQSQALSQSTPPLNLSLAPTPSYLQSLENSVNKIKDVEEVEILNDKISRRSDESTKDVEEEADADNNHEVTSQNEDSIVSVGEEKVDDNNDDTTESENVTTDESFINVEEEENESGADDNGKFVEENLKSVEKKIARKVRFASTDSSGLQIFSNVASCEKVTETVASKIERSKSLDSKHDFKELSEVKVCNGDEHERNNDADDAIFNDKQKMSKKKKLKLQEKSLSKLKKKKLKIKRMKKKLVRVENANVITEAKNVIEANSEYTEESMKNVNILSNFKETFQKFRASYLSRNTADTKQSQASPKKIPTLENWTTIMQEKKKKDATKKLETEEKSLNNNKHVIEAISSIIEDDQTNKCCTDAPEIEFKNEDEELSSSDIKNEEDFTNNNDFVPKQISNDEEDDYRSLKKKLKLKKKHKEEVKEEHSDDDNMAKKKKKRKKEKRDRKEKGETRESKDEKKRKDKDRRREHKKEKKPKTESRIIVKPLPPAPKPPPEPCGPPASCVLTVSHLEDGLRVLLRLGGHFYTSRLTEISPPDIYGVVVDKERGNKPHILSREEVLERAVLDVKPINTTQLSAGMRVCAYWSSKMTFLHPGTVSGPDTDQDYVIIQLDDGDCRDIHHSQIRYLPPDYPTVDGDNTALLTNVSRKRSSAGNDVEEIPEKVEKSANKKQHKDHKEKKRKQREGEWFVSVTEVSQHKKKEINETNCLEEESDEPATPTTPTDAKTTSSNRSPIAAFLPPQHSLWCWNDDGWRQSTKSRRVLHKSIKKGDNDTLNVGDCAVFLSTSRPDRPYIGRIHSMWQTGGGNMKVQVRWFYHPAEVEGSAEGGGRVDDLKMTSNALFASSHADENDVQTISHKCSLLSFDKYQEIIEKSDDDLEDVYYLAGDYDPVVGTIKFSPGVI